MDVCSQEQIPDNHIGVCCNRRVLDENSILRRVKYAHEEQILRSEIEKYRNEYEESTRRLGELAVDSGAIERVAREKYLMKKPNEDIYVFDEDLED